MTMSTNDKGRDGERPGAAGPLAWKVHHDRRLVGPEGGKRHLLVEVTARKPEKRERPARPPLNLALVIDASGSMSGAPLEAAKAGALGVIGSLQEHDRLTIVSFASDILLHVDALAMDEQGRRRAGAAVRALETRGCTNLAGGWLEGCDRVAAEMERRPGCQNRVLLLSDGHANEGNTDPESLALEAADRRQRGIYTSTVGIGLGYSPVQLQALSEQGGGRMHHAPTAEDIVAVIAGELGEILETAADDLELTIDGDRRLPAVPLGPYPVRREAGLMVVTLGTMVAGGTRRLVLQVSVPSGREGETLGLRLRPSWVPPAGGERVRGETLAVEFRLVPAAELAAELPDRALRLEIARLWHAEILRRSTAMNEEGRYEEARQYVEEAMTELCEYCAGLQEMDPYLWRLEQHGERVVGMMGADVRCGIMCDGIKLLKGDRDYRASPRDPGLDAAPPPARPPRGRGRPRGGAPDNQG